MFFIDIFIAYLWDTKIAPVRGFITQFRSLKSVKNWVSYSAVFAGGWELQKKKTCITWHVPLHMQTAVMPSEKIIYNRRARSTADGEKDSCWHLLLYL